MVLNVKLHSYAATGCGKLDRPGPIRSADGWHVMVMDACMGQADVFLVTDRAKERGSCSCNARLGGSMGVVPMVL